MLPLYTNKDKEDAPFRWRWGLAIASIISFRFQSPFRRLSSFSTRADADADVNAAAVSRHRLRMMMTALAVFSLYTYCTRRAIQKLKEEVLWRHRQSVSIFNSSGYLVPTFSCASPLADHCERERADGKEKTPINFLLPLLDLMRVAPLDWQCERGR